MAGYKFYSNILSNLNKNQQDITKSCLSETPQYSRKECIYYRNITDLEKKNNVHSQKRPTELHS